MIVFTGLSGSGKSSLAFDTIFAEGQRRYVESLSAYARQFLGPDGQTRRRLHRGPLARGVDRPEVDQPQPALDRRHHHRGLRLPAPALRPRRNAALPGVRRADRPPDPAADRRPGPRDGRGTPVPGTRTGGPHPQGRVRRPVRQAQHPGLQQGAGRRRRASADRSAEAEEAGEARHRGRRRPAHGQGQRQAAAHRLGRDRAEPRRRHRRARVRRSGGRPPAPRAALLREAGLPERAPAGRRRSRAPVVLVQLALRRVPGMRRSRHPQGGRPRPRRTRSRPDAGRGRRSRRGRWATPPSTSPGCCPAWATSSASTSTPRGRSCPPRRARRFSRAATSRCTSGTRTATAAPGPTTPTSKA